MIVPVRNEAMRLTTFIDAMSPLLDAPFGDELVVREVVVVDDASTDTTQSDLRTLAGRPGWTILAASSQGRGKGDAVARGTRAASFPFVLLSDVDLAAAPVEAVKLARALRRGADIAIGSRDVVGSSVIAPFSRKLAGRTFNAFVRATTGLPNRDTQCGFKLMPVELARSLLSSLRVPGLAFDVELLMRARIGGYRVDEVPITYVHDERSQVHPALHGPAMCRDVLRLVYHLRIATNVSERRANARASP